MVPPDRGTVSLTPYVMLHQRETLSPIFSNPPLKKYTKNILPTRYATSSGLVPDSLATYEIKINKLLLTKKILP